MNEKRERGTGRVFLRGTVYWIQYYDHGRQVRESSGETDERKAEKFLRKRIGQVANDIGRDNRSLRYESIRDAYLAEAETQGRKALRRDRKGNVYLESVRRMDDFFGGRRVVEIDTDLMRRYQRELQGKGFANGTINRSLASLRKMFTLAQRDRKIHNLPFFPMLPEAKPRQGTLPHEKYVALVNALPEYLRPALALGFHTGMRRGEVLGLKWSNVNFLERVIRLEDSKNGEAREIPFAGELEIVLREQHAKRQPGCEHVCFRERRGRVERLGDFRKPWRRVCVSLGLGRVEQAKDERTGEPVFERRRYPRSKPKPKMVYNGLLFHDLRRTFVTDAEHAGAPRHEVMMVSGHKTESVYKRYAIGNREQRRVALEHIADYRSQKFGDKSGTVEVAEVPEQPVVQ